MKIKIATMAALMAAAGAAQAQHVANLGNLFVDSNGLSIDMNGAAIPAGTYTSFSVSVDWVVGGGNPWSNEAIWALTDIAAFPGPANTFYADPGNAGNSAANGDPVTLLWSGSFASQSVEDGSFTGQNYNGGDSLFFNALQTFGGSNASWNNTVVTLGFDGGSGIWTENFASGTTATGNFWDRPIGVGPSISGLGPVQYATTSFLVTADGNYDLASLTFQHDGYLHLYAGSFDPNNQLTNLIGGDDDGPIFGLSSSVITGVALTTGTTYIAVISAFAASGAGDYSLNLLGPGTIVPAPASLALLGLGGLVATRRRRA